MSLFGNIMSKIFGHAGAAAPAPGQPGAGGATAASASPSPSASPSQTAGAPAGAASGPAQTVDVAAILTEMASKNPQTLNWKTSIVDLLKLLDLDSSLDARKQLAQELHYTGNTNDSASMNMWLHKAVMQELAKNGGKVPDELRV